MIVALPDFSLTLFDVFALHFGVINSLCSVIISITVSKELLYYKYGQ